MCAEIYVDLQAKKTQSGADGYLYNMIRWAKRVDLDLSGCPNVTAFAASVEARPKVVEALKAEGLM